ncbi:MAG: polysaccharide deacetylase family protein [Hyphomicrobiaceae bacterium]|nr:polysaccharide deacetylase family protein [Hyphomicrobiaceae bacterium]
MRTWFLCGLVAAGVLLPAGGARAEEPCTPGPGRLGVSRTIEIDAASGPRFGGKKKEYEILEPGEVILTFDDGPIRAYTRPILNALEAHCSKATFFLVGKMAISDPATVKEYVRRGHTVGVHTWSHANLTHLTPLKARHEIELGISAVAAALGRPPAPFFRFPYLAEPRSMILHLQGRHMATFNIDVDSKDYRFHDAGDVHRKVMGDLAAAGKGIILFHDIQASTARALPALLDDLKASGYRIVHMVPKEPATTDPSYDAIAQRALERKHVASAQDMPRRAWPTLVTPSGEKGEEGARRARPAQAAPPSGNADQPFGWLSKIFQQ